MKVNVDFLGDCCSVSWETICRDEEFPIQSKACLVWLRVGFGDFVNDMRTRVVTLGSYLK